MIKLNKYRIYDEYTSIDTENAKGTRTGYISIERGYYLMHGNLPAYIKSKLVSIAVKRGLKPLNY